MSITEAFRNLNQSIRGIRQDEQAAKQSQQEHELDKAKLDYQMNDPERLYKRQVFGEKIKEVEFDSGIVINPDNASLDQTFAFNQSRDILNSIMPDGMELTNKGVGVATGTTTKLRMPQWKANELKAQLNIAMAMESGKEAMTDNEITSLTNKLTLSDAVLKEGRELSPKDRMDKGHQTARLGYLQDRRDNPESYSKMLMDDNKSNMASLNKLYRMPTQNEKLITMLHNKIKLNNGMLGSMSDSGSLKNMVGHTYTLTNRDGSKNSITHYGKKGSIMPPVIPGPGGTYVRGKTGAAPGAGDKGANKLTELSKQTKVWKDLANVKNGIASAKSGILNENAILALVANDPKTTPKYWKDLFHEDTEEVLGNLNTLYTRMISTYTGQKWFDEKLNPMDRTNSHGLPKRKRGVSINTLKRNQTLTPKQHEQRRGH